MSSSSFENMTIESIAQRIEEDLQSKESLELLKKSISPNSKLSDSLTNSIQQSSQANLDPKRSHSTTIAAEASARSSAETNTESNTSEATATPQSNVIRDNIYQKIVALYAKGKTPDQISETIKEISRDPVPTASIHRRIDDIIEETHSKRGASLEAEYPIVFFNISSVRTQKDLRLDNQDICFALGITADGQKQILGLWTLLEDPVASWSAILQDIANRGTQRILISCTCQVDEFATASQSVFPTTHIQYCMMQLLGNSLRLVAPKERKEISEGLKRILTSLKAEDAEYQFKNFSSCWQTKYRSIVELWEDNWEHILPLYNYPTEISRLISGTTTIETLNTAVRKACKNRGIFPDEATAETVIFLSLEQISNKWQLPVKDWKQTQAQFANAYKEGKLVFELVV